MKKTLIALAVLAAAGNLAHAQSNVTIYGIVDAGLVNERGGKAGTATKITSGVGSTSRLGFRGTEELGDGLAALFVLESGFKTDTGESDVAGSLFNRQSFVGVKSKSAGSLTLGRQYSPWYNTLTVVADPFAAGYSGSAKNLLPAKLNTRTSNTILYASPVIEGVSGELAYSFGEQVGDSKAGAQIGAALALARGPLNVRLAYSRLNSDVAAVGATPALIRDAGRNTLLAANYDFTVAKAFFAYGWDKGFNSGALANTTNAFGFAVAPKPSTDSSDLLLGASVPVGASGTLLASYIRKDDKQFNQDATQWAVGYSLALSKRSSVYASFAKIRNKNGAGYTVGNATEAGTGDKATNLGLRHAF